MMSSTRGKFVRRGAFGLAATACLLFAAPAAVAADEVLIDDGSRLLGTVTGGAGGELTVETDYAGELTVPVDRVRGVTIDRRVVVQTADGRRLQGTVGFEPPEGQWVVDPRLGRVEIDAPEIVALWNPDEEPPPIAAVRQDYEAKLPEWSATIDVGVNGKTGNTELQNLHVRAATERTTPTERLSIFGESVQAEQEGEQSANEVIGGVRLEVDLGDRLFAFGDTRLEFDEFEDLDLRTTASGGLGYFFLEEEEHTFKTRFGAGFQHESFSDGTSDSNGIAQLGYEYVNALLAWLELTHRLTYHPTFSSPLEEYRIFAETIGAVPLAGLEGWSLRAGVRNSFDADPIPGIEELDTIYFLNLGIELE